MCAYRAMNKINGSKGCVEKEHVRPLGLGYVVGWWEVAAEAEAAAGADSCALLLT
jgi:hypothetical protein